MNRAYAIIKRQYKNRKNVIKCSSQNFLKINKILNKNQILKVKNLKKNLFLLNKKINNKIQKIKVF